MAGKKLSHDEVLKMRHLYYRRNHSFNQLGKLHHVSAMTIRSAVFGLGAYWDIPDDITEEEKARRAQMYGAKTKPFTQTEID